VSRPLSDFPKVLASMGSAASRLDVETVAPMTLAVASAVRLRGGRYGIKGRSGAKVRLGARSNVRGFGDRVKVGNVKGDPAGFWRIVTDGSGKHLIVGRHKRGGGRQTVAGARRRFANVDNTLGNTNPIKLGAIGYRQYAVHPGHRGFGNPWGEAMSDSNRLVGPILAKTATSSFAKAWKS
jgi:hypothetical protein